VVAVSQEVVIFMAVSYRVALFAMNPITQNHGLELKNCSLTLRRIVTSHLVVLLRTSFVPLI
jgi:hypothetical protein